MITPQRLKWAVYTLLFLDFILYFIQDVESARFTLDARSSLAECARAYVTSIDLVAWFGLIILFELETYVLRGEAWTAGRKWTVQGVRLLCYLTVLHTSFAYDVLLSDFQQPRALPTAADACAYADGDWSFLRNREYTELDRSNCAGIGRGPDFYAIGDASVITDREGLREGLILAWTDLIESIAWLLVVFAEELVLRLEHRASGGGGILKLLERSRSALYVLILLIAVYWGLKGQFLYFWDDVIWVCGFLMIDRNIRDWHSATGSPESPPLRR